MAVRFDFSDVNSFFQKGKDEVKAVEREVGEKAVQYAIDNGSYQNRTGRLRKSNSSNATDDGLELRNTAPYASFVEYKGFNVLKRSVLFAYKELSERIK